VKPIHVIPDLNRQQPTVSTVKPGIAWGYTSLLLFLYLLNWTDKAVLGLAAQPLAREFGLTPLRSACWAAPSIWLSR
jgi:hypothetical protein